METYYTLEEKYIQALEEMRYGETAKALRILKDLLEAEPQYARTYFQLGKIYYYEVQDYQSAGYYFKRCTELEPGFPDVYQHYLKLLVFLRMEKQAKQIVDYAVSLPGVNTAVIYHQLGLLEEILQNWELALENYYKALKSAISDEEIENLQQALKRIQLKVEAERKYRYQLA